MPRVISPPQTTGGGHLIHTPVFPGNRPTPTNNTSPPTSVIVVPWGYGPLPWWDWNSYGGGYSYDGSNGGYSDPSSNGPLNYGNTGDYGSAPRPSTLPATSPTTSRTQRQLQASDEYQRAETEMRDAHAAYEAALARARRSVLRERAYQQAIAEKLQAAREVEAIQAAYREPPSTQPAAQPEPIPPQLIHAAQAKLDAATDMTRLESGLIESNPEVKAASQRLDAATDRLNLLKRQ